MIRYTLTEGGHMKPLRLGISEKKLIAQLSDPRNFTMRKRTHNAVTRSLLPEKHHHYWEPLTTVRHGWRTIHVQSVFFPNGRIWDSHYRGWRPTIKELNREIQKVRDSYHVKNLMNLAPIGIRKGIDTLPLSRIETPDFIAYIIDDFPKHPAPEFGEPVRINLKPIRDVQQRLEKIVMLTDDLMSQSMRRILDGGGPNRTFEGIVPFIHRTSDTPARTEAPMGPEFNAEEFIKTLREVFAPPKHGTRDVK